MPPVSAGGMGTACYHKKAASRSAFASEVAGSTINADLVSDL
jgi:hypothetical protein